MFRSQFHHFKPSIPEGAFCVWTYEELEKLLVVGGNKKDFEVLVEYFNVRPEGNVATRNDPHGELKGRNVLTVVGSDPDTANCMDKKVCTFIFCNNCVVCLKRPKINGK